MQCAHTVPPSQPAISRQMCETWRAAVEASLVQLHLQPTPTVRTSAHLVSYLRHRQLDKFHPKINTTCHGCTSQTEQILQRYHANFQHQKPLHTIREGPDGSHDCRQMASLRPTVISLKLQRITVLLLLPNYTAW